MIATMPYLFCLLVRSTFVYVLKLHLTNFKVLLDAAAFSNASFTSIRSQDLTVITQASIKYSLVSKSLP